MIKAKLSMVPWDAVRVVEAPQEDFIAAAQRWWAREIPHLPNGIPFDSVMGIGRVLAYGCIKYPLDEGRAWETHAAYHRASYHFDALMRHAFTEGICDESGLLHEWHAMTRYMMLAALETRGLMIDDRPAAAPRADEVHVPYNVTVVRGGTA